MPPALLVPPIHASDVSKRGMLINGTRRETRGLTGYRAVNLVSLSPDREKGPLEMLYVAVPVSIKEGFVCNSLLYLYIRNLRDGRRHLCL
jgi:hypothetical protein